MRLKEFVHRLVTGFHDQVVQEKKKLKLILIITSNGITKLDLDLLFMILLSNFVLCGHL